MTEYQVDPNQLIEALGDEIGILSVNMVKSQLTIANLSMMLSNVSEENESLRKHIINLDTDLKNIREQLSEYIDNRTKLVGRTQLVDIDFNRHDDLDNRTAISQQS